MGWMDVIDVDRELKNRTYLEELEFRLEHKNRIGLIELLSRL